MLDQAVAAYIASAPRIASGAASSLSDRELQFLALLGACPLAEGEILEIGCGEGISTVVLAGAARLAGEPRVSAIDPLVNTSCRSLAAFERKLQTAGVANIVDFHQVPAHEISDIWDRPLRLLWIASEYAADGAEIDFHDFVPHLTDGGIVAFHDVIQRGDGALHVFTEDVLCDEHFGATGLVGTIGWARYHHQPAHTRKYQSQKQKLYRRLAPLLPYVANGGPAGWWSKLSFKLHCSRVPHQTVEAESWLKDVA